MKNFVRNYFTEFALALATVVSIIVAVVFSIWEWVENPGGIFRDEYGTNWQFVFETAWSWLIPTFVHIFVAASLAHLAWTCTRLLMTRFSNWSE